MCETGRDCHVRGAAWRRVQMPSHRDAQDFEGFSTVIILEGQWRASAGGSSNTSAVRGWLREPMRARGRTR